MADNRKPPKDPDVFTDNKLKLYAQPLEQGARAPSLRVKMIENNPCIDIDTGLKTEGRNGKDGFPIKIETPMEPKSFRILMDMIIRVAAFPNPVGFEIENWGHPFLWDKGQGKSVRSVEKVVVSRFAVIKRDDGMVVLGATAKGKKDVEFEFTPNDFHLLMQNGQPMDVKISSQLAATAWAGLWKDVFVQEFTKGWTEPEYMKRRRLENMQRAQGGGGYQQQRPQQSNQQSQQPRPTAHVPDEGFDEEIPF